MNIEFTDEPGFVDPRDLARRKFQEDLQRSESTLSCLEDQTEPNSSMGGTESEDTQTENLPDIEFSKSMILMLELLKDNWSTTMKTLLTNQEERVERLERGFAAVSSSNLRIESLNLKTQAEYQRLNSVIQKTEDGLPDLCTEVQATSLNLRTAELTVQRRLAKIDNKVQKIKEFGSYSSISPSLVNTVNSAIIQGPPTMTLDCVTQEMEDLSQALYTERQFEI